jgi:hypothetical protein
MEEQQEEENICRNGRYLLDFSIIIPAITASTIRGTRIYTQKNISQMSLQMLQMSNLNQYSRQHFLCSCRRAENFIKLNYLGTFL